MNEARALARAEWKISGVLYARAWGSIVRASRFHAAARRWAINSAPARVLQEMRAKLSPPRLPSGTRPFLRLLRPPRGRD